MMKIYECPVCNKKFSERECFMKINWDSNTQIIECPKCHTNLIKSDNGEYIEYED